MNLNIFLTILAIICGIAHPASSSDPFGSELAPIEQRKSSSREETIPAIEPCDPLSKKKLSYTVTVEEAKKFNNFYCGHYTAFLFMSYLLERKK